MLVRIALSCRERARRILTLLCFLPRPLTVPEVINAIAVDIDAERYDPDRKLENADDLLCICLGLIDITAHLSDEDDLSDDDDDLLDDDDSSLTTGRFDESITRTEIVRIAHFLV
jgi:hypothetical protein